MFTIDPRIQSTSLELGDWPLSRVLLKNEKNYPWFILVPRQANVQEWYELSEADRALLTEEITQLSRLVKNFFTPHKINVATLGNVVPQLHIHIVGRNSHDPLWPQGIWQSSLAQTPYNNDELDELMTQLKAQITAIKFV